MRCCIKSLLLVVHFPLKAACLHLPDNMFNLLQSVVVYTWRSHWCGVMMVGNNINERILASFSYLQN